MNRPRPAGCGLCTSCAPASIRGISRCLSPWHVEVSGVACRFYCSVVAGHVLLCCLLCVWMAFNKSSVSIRTSCQGLSPTGPVASVCGLILLWVTWWPWVCVDACHKKHSVLCTRFCQSLTRSHCNQHIYWTITVSSQRIIYRARIENQIIVGVLKYPVSHEALS